MYVHGISARARAHAHLGRDASASREGAGGGGNGGSSGSTTSGSRVAAAAGEGGDVERPVIDCEGQKGLRLARDRGAGRMGGASSASYARGGSPSEAIKELFSYH